MGCRSLVCHICQRDEEAFISICKYCDAFVCLIGECVDDPTDDDGVPLSCCCDECYDMVYLQCEEDSGRLHYCQMCDWKLCRDCEQESGAAYTVCHNCGGREWCNDCAPIRVLCALCKTESY
jgi:hypothetical protein